MIELSPEERDNFANLGFAIICRDEIREMRQQLVGFLKTSVLSIIRKLWTAEPPAELEEASFCDVMTWVHENETDQRISRAIYEVFQSLPPVMGMINHPTILDVVKATGIARPTVGTAPLIRIDRPNDRQFATPAHQDYWYSMIGDNSIVIWFPLVPLTKDMGSIAGIPGSHKGGLIDFVPTGGHEPYAPQKEFDDDCYTEIFIPDDNLLVFNQYLLHRSGFNRSRSPRVSMQLRFNDLDAMEEMTSCFTAVHSRFVVERQRAVLQRTGTANQ